MTAAADLFKFDQKHLKQFSAASTYLMVVLAARDLGTFLLFLYPNAGCWNPTKTKQASSADHHLNTSTISWAEMDGSRQTILPEQDTGTGKILGAEEGHKLAEQDLVDRKWERWCIVEQDQK